VPTNKQRREAARRHLERQLQRRQEREVARRRFTLVASIVGTLVLIAAIVLTVVLISNADTGNGHKKKAASGNSTSPSPTAPAVSSPSPQPSTSYPPATGPAVTFDGVTVKGAADLRGEPAVTSKATRDPAKLEFKDLVVGKGAAATSSSTVSVQYVGALLKGGKVFDSSWGRGMPASFSVAPGQVIPGFSLGIAGGKGVPPMKVGGRRLIIMPAASGYGKTPPPGSGIPKNAPLIFVVDLKDIAN
jgi:peptidylprolyl isomerase